MLQAIELLFTVVFYIWSMFTEHVNVYVSLVYKLIGLGLLRHSNQMVNPFHIYDF